MKRQKLPTAVICFIGALQFATAGAWDFESKPVNVTVQVGQETLIACKAPANINPKYRYIKANGTLTARAIPNSDGLLITNVQHIDEGWYECIVDSDEGTQSSSTYLHVVDALTFSTRPHNVTVSPGHTATLNCAVTTGSRVSYTWLKNGQPITFSDKITVAGGTLTVSAVELSDVDLYTCKATTTSGHSINADAAILITGLKAPQFSTIPKDIVIPMSASGTTAHCAATGSPTPQMKWQHNGKTISDETTSTVLARPNGDLRVNQAPVTVSGLYTCIASNIKGSISHSITIRIITHVTTPKPSTEGNSSAEILGDTTLFISTVAAAILLALLVAVGIIIWWRCGRKKGYPSRRSSYSSRRSSRRRRMRRRDYADEFNFGRSSWDTPSHPSFMMGFPDRRYSSSMPISEFDYNSRPVSFNFASFSGHNRSFSPSNIPHPGNAYQVSNPTFGLDDIESTLQRQMRELDAFERSSQCTPRSDVSSHRGRSSQKVRSPTAAATSTPKSDNTTDATRYSTLSQMMSGEPFEEPEEWGPEHEVVLNVQANIRMSRLWEVNSTLRAMKMAQYDEESDDDTDK